MATPIRDRHHRVREALERERVDWLLVPASADFTWLTGGHARASERLVCFALPRRGEPFALVPALEAGPLRAECPWLEVESWDDGEDAFLRLARRAGLDRRPALAAGEGWRTPVLLRLAAAAPCRPAGAILEPLRAVKDEAELALLATASAHADAVVMEAAAHARPGMTERELTAWILARFEALGDTAPWAIVAAGPHAASPHHVSTDRRLGAGEVLLIDCGAFTSGYASDVTRTVVLGEPSAEVARVAALVDEARRAGIAAVRAGAIPEEVDRAARAVIERGGHGPHFTHRLGHGVGLEIHEAPNLVAGNREPLRAGNVHSVEPGIYLPGRFGVRIEDLVVVEDGGARPLNHAPHGLAPGGRPAPAPAA